MEMGLPINSDGRTIILFWSKSGTVVFRFPEIIAFELESDDKRQHVPPSGGINITLLLPGRPGSPVAPAPGEPGTYIFESLEAAPPVTLATRSWDSSFFRSSSCLSSSSFFLPRRSLALILA